MEVEIIVAPTVATSKESSHSIKWTIELIMLALLLSTFLICGCLMFRKVDKYKGDCDDAVQFWMDQVLLLTVQERFVSSTRPHHSVTPRRLSQNEEENCTPLGHPMFKSSSVMLTMDEDKNEAA